MCGIAGIYYRDRCRPVDRTVLHAMAGAIEHRGPDAEGLWSAPGIGLAHRRLSIVDLAGGDQPIDNEDGSVQVIFNGEIYNYRELRHKMLARGHRFRTQSDTEVLVHLYEEYGEDLVHHLRGMFAFAIWDERHRRLLLARDRVGLKPLYYYSDREKVVFGSEIKAILAYPQVDLNIDPVALDEYFYLGMIPGDASIFREIRKLPAAHTLLIQDITGQQSPRRYWEYQPTVDYSLTLPEWREAIEEKIKETIQQHLIADVPVGAFLSGGVDSSVMVAVCSQLIDRPLQTFAIGFREQTQNELPYAREVAAYFGCDHTEELVTAEAITSLIDLVKYYDEPFADSSAIPTMLVSRLARQRVKVVISGDGGDEAFGGYRRYAHDLKEAAVRAHLPVWLRQHVLANMASCWPKLEWLPRILRAKTTLTNLALPAADAYANTVAFTRQAGRKRLLAADVVAQLTGRFAEDRVSREYSRAAIDDPLAGMISADVGVLLPDDFLTKVDRASMSCGLEVRPPLVDHELLELTARIPSNFKVYRGTTKWIFKEIYRQQLPPGVTSRRKQGFEIPVDQWLAGPLRDLFESTVLHGHNPVADLIDTREVRRLHNSHCAGAERNGAVLWSVLILSSWAQQYLRPVTEYAG